MELIPNNLKKIDVVVKYFYPVAAGIETNIMETYSVLAKNGWDVTIHTSKDLYLEKNVLPQEEIIRGLKVKRYAFGRFGFFPGIKWQKTSAVALHNFDIFPHLQILFYAGWLKLLSKKPFAFFITPHGGFNPEWSMFSPLKRAIKRFYHYTLGVWLINRVADGVRAVSEWEKQAMAEKGIKAELLRVIANGLEGEAFLDVDALASAEIKEKVKNLGSYAIQIARVYPIKNYETALKALALADAGIKFVIVGPVEDMAYKYKLEKLIQELGINNRVVFLGIVRGVDKYYLIRHAVAMVHMAIWESFCNVVHEAMSQGVVCLVADNYALPYLVKDGINGYCLPTYDAAALARKIDFIFHNNQPEVIGQMRENNRAFALAHSWTRVAESMESFYTEKIIEAAARLPRSPQPVKLA